jgi:hypothetical protein
VERPRLIGASLSDITIAVFMNLIPKLAALTDYATDTAKRFP